MAEQFWSEVAMNDQDNRDSPSDSSGPKEKRARFHDKSVHFADQPNSKGISKPTTQTTTQEQATAIIPQPASQPKIM